MSDGQIDSQPVMVDKSLEEALLLHSNILQLRKPAKNTLKAFKKWFEPEPRKTRLRGNSSRILDDESDLVALRVPTDQDRLTQIVQTYFPWLFVVGSRITPRISHTYVSTRPKHPAAQSLTFRNTRLAALLP